MGMIDRFIGGGAAVAAVTEAAGNVAEIFTPNSTRRMELDEEAYARAIGQHQAEFAAAPRGWFDGAMNGMNRLPRPLLTLGTIGLFIYAMVEPVGFSARMEGLALVPEPLWWLMGAIVSFYFGAREAHYFRSRVWPRAKVRATVAREGDGWRAPAPPVPTPEQAAADYEAGWRAPYVPTGLEDAVSGGAGHISTSVEVTADPADAAGPLTPAVAVPADRNPDRFADNAALRDWAAGL